MEIQVEDGVARAVGDMTLSSVGPMADRLDTVFRNGVTITLDLSQVGECDSAALALLLEWARRARQKGSAIALQNIPMQLSELANAHDLPSLEEILAGQLGLVRTDN